MSDPLRKFHDIQVDLAFTTGLGRIGKFEATSPALAELHLIADGCWIEYKNPSTPQFSSVTPDGWRRASVQVVDVAQSIQGLHYHLANIRRIERRLDRLIQRFYGRTEFITDDNGRYSWGLTNKMTFEFQAYASLLHRHLVYLAGLLGTLLGGHKCPNLRSVQKLLALNRGAGQIDLLRVLQLHQGWLEQLYSRGNPKKICLRDELAHESFVPAGGFHIRGMKAHVWGQLASDLNRVEPAFRVYRLGDEMHRQLESLDRFLFDICRSVDLGLVPRPAYRIQLRKNMGSTTGEFGTVAIPGMIPEKKL